MLVWIDNESELSQVWQYASSRRIARRVIGKGSNVLVSDRGLSGITVKLTGNLSTIRPLDVSAGYLDVEVGCGCSLGKLLAWARTQGLGGLEGLVGIPGTVGGAIKCSAGTKIGCIGDHLLEARMLSRKRIGWHKATKLGLGYRRSTIGSLSVVVSARFRLVRKTSTEVAESYENARKARGNQPRGVRSAGCFFKNPKKRSAGALIEASGCKGIRLGDAMVSLQHANYIVNAGKAKAQDILRLAHKVMYCVRHQSGIHLEREVELWGWTRGG